MDKMTKILISGFVNHSLLVAERFIEKVETGRARSKKTYQDMKEIKEEAETLKRQLELD